MLNQLHDFILFSQHGWADNGKDIAALSRKLITSKTYLVAPDLGFINTWLRIEPLIGAVEKLATDTINKHPNTPIRIVGHSMGGLIWLEVLNKHPEWWSKVESLILVGSPVGGSDLGRLIDPFGFGIGIARDLGINRRQIAERIAKEIPTLIIAGDIDGGSDGTVTVDCTKFRHAKFVCLPGIPHAVLKNHPTVAEVIKDFWGNPKLTNLSNLELDLTTELIERVQLVTGMTDAHRRDFYRSQAYLKFIPGSSIRLWKNPFQIDHIFVANSESQCLYSGFVGWRHAEELYKTLADIKKDYYLHLHV